MQTMRTRGRAGSMLLVVAIVVALAGAGLRSIAEGSSTDPGADLDAEEQRVVDLVNVVRTAQGLVPLVVSPTLSAAADWMAQDLADQGALSHVDSLGRGLRERLTAFGYPAQTTVRENVAAGYVTGSDVVAGWIDSPAHRENIFAEEARAIGIARVYDPNTSFGWFWAQQFGSLDDSASAGGAEDGAPASDDIDGPATPSVFSAPGAFGGGDPPPPGGIANLTAVGEQSVGALAEALAAAGCERPSLAFFVTDAFLLFFPGIPAISDLDAADTVIDRRAFFVACS